MIKPRWLVLLFALVALQASPVFAHAALLASTPAANATLARAPAQVELLFTEPLEPSLSTITVLNSDGAPVDGGDVRVDPAEPTRMTVSLRSLADGVYTVSWQALSTADGHVTTGSFPFVVGEGAGASPASTTPISRSVRVSLLEIVAKWLGYLALALLTGGTLFILLVWIPATIPDVRPNWMNLAGWALIALALSMILAVLTQAGQASGAEIVFPWSFVTGTLLSSTRYGALWLARLCLMLGLGALLYRPEVAFRQRRLALGVAALALLTISLGSHAAAEPDPWLPVLADWLHLAAASVWVGGLGHFLFGLWSLRDLKPELRRRTIAALIRRFSALALVSVGVLTLTGVYSAVLQLGAWAALTGTTYGQALLVKLLLATPMVALGAFNLLIVRPAMEQRVSESLMRRFRNTVTGEVGLSVVLLLSVSVLTAIPPAETGAQRPTLSGSQIVDDLTVAIEIAPGRIGVNDFSVRVTSNGQPVSDAREVEVQFAPQSGKLPPSKVPFAPQGDGVYAVRGSYFSLPDEWQVRVAVRRTDRFDSYAQFNFAVGTTAALPFRWEQLCAALIALAGLGVPLFFFERRGWMRGAGIVLALAMIGAAGVALTRPPAGEVVGPANPIPPDAASIRAGQQLYRADCLPCHGPSGQGDGPVGITLNPRPADLVQHTVSGVHTDGQLYEWITNGYPGSVMPAFKSVLSDEQRWHVVNYLRSLAPQ